MRFDRLLAVTAFGLASLASAPAFAHAKLQSSDPPAVMSAPLPPLPAGEYRIQWTMMTHDAHKVKDEVAFKVK